MSSPFRFRGLFLLLLLGLGVTVFGGQAILTVRSVEAAGAWAWTGSMITGRWGHTATLLPTGRVLVTGGANEQTGPYASLASAELYDL